MLYATYLIWFIYFNFYDAYFSSNFLDVFVYLLHMQSVGDKDSVISWLYVITIL